ncbi:beta galactosidase [Halalkalibacter wakoensis JCM 9140]|uniref:Beta galactosidase n=1 Tax=Halalkalibacter wakoensis JCM 9140 TaxID=1236970 RepID=W4Q9V3_9BACI|nr:hypothetical protein [Halalkalibacter wakoensis]GAE28418.1 beta galactosidase [Halalkalibacter wakoensis JCM 9140]
MIITGHDQSGTVVKVASVTSKTVARTASYYNADDMIFTYDGLWQQSTLADHRENLASFSDDTEATVSFTFEGTGFRWIGYRGRTQGIADVFINGEHVAEVDTYDSEAAFQQTLYEVSGLNKGEHTVTISVKGTSRPEAENQRIHVDGIEVINN